MKETIETNGLEAAVLEKFWKFPKFVNRNALKMKIFGKFSRTQDVLQKSLLIAEKMGQNFSLIVLFAFLRGGG